ncbi:MULTISPECIES: type I-E CRISPR-associated protein Cse1/CasA [Rothia]|jgi:CRISPR system CASCADE complex protein casA|uniref:CRISPR-associated protein n=2 Tax=Rothia aeria TaxID=172042 RepID=A0A2Z5QZJ6_9MICC|nr:MULTISPECIES: type I-E CRISPR-associated protein Cse1/CasA [Rothia]EID50558.1 CRISPR-associated protein CasA/Cse1, type I-E [Rothia aeria F0474]MDK7676795.1 type I-E CRISPR-associated protein Cse1/CasA [Rothia aeria]MDO4884595.1 type I-E CRISPR-associated protein Cse1/CasA [Rothia sp. (in: high G+C Gram-positive bacteria)]QQT89395.1 type I-E CRISPR-associated protein Cse1/CasA [Rothia aeria]BAV87857.1 CRISPR-associated protein [Rothia aeria]
MSDDQSVQSNTSPDFNLCNEPWIPVLYVSGQTQEVSLKQLFDESNSIRKIHSGDATTDVAILGVAVAIFFRAVLENTEEYGELYREPKKWIQNISSGGSEQLYFVQDYLKKYQDRFNLFDAERPFMQVADLHTSKGEVKPVSRLVLDSESEYFSMRAEQALTSLSYAEAARYLVTVQAYDYSGIKSGAVGDPRVKGGRGYPIGVGWYGTTGKIIIHGENLIETLLYCIDYEQLLNVEKVKGKSHRIALQDKPVWERELPDTAAPRAYKGGDPTKYKDEPAPAAGMCEILTWQSRRVRLFPENGRVTGVLVSNGDKWLDRNTYTDPLTAYRFSKNQSTQTHYVWMPQTHSAERTLWRGADALLTRLSSSQEKQNKPATVIRQISSGKYFSPDTKTKIQLVGMVYGTQSSIVEETIDESVTLELGILTEQGAEISAMVRDNIQLTMDASIALGQYAGNLLRAAGKEYEFRPSVTESILHRMEDEFRSWLADLSVSDDVSAQAAKWQSKVRRILESEADQLAVSAGPKAAIGTIYDEQLYNTAKARRQFGGRLYKLLPLAYSSTITRVQEENHA